VGQVLRHFLPASTMAFCNTKAQCRELVQVLQAEGMVALALHGDLEQRERDQVLVQFANRSASVLVATDVAARGLDVAQLEMVINVDVTPDAEVHVHRIGRTGRAGAQGLAVNLVSMDEMGAVGRIELLGALTADLGYTREQVGKIDINEFATYVAVARSIAREAVARLNQGRIKGRAVKARLLADEA
jgi:ATP-dependent RNA helicase DbpA